MKELFEGKRILITGGTGSVGCALTRKLFDYNPRTIRILDISENETFKMMNLFADNDCLRFLIGDIRDKNRLKSAMQDIDIVFHFAAMKHVYACEYNSFEAVKTNIDGLQNVIETALENNVEKMIFSSTDKAAHPLSVMGITKLLGEKLVASANYYKGNRRTRFASVRFGNVIGSNGSVVPLFRQQIVGGGPVTITDREMTRFVIEMDETVALIFSAVHMTKGGETFVWKMRTLRVVDLAEVMIERYAPGKGIEQVFSGRGEAEKVHEEIMTEEELPNSVELNNLYVLFPSLNYLHLVEKYAGNQTPRNPVIASNKGIYMTKNEINQVLENIDHEKSFAN